MRAHKIYKRSVNESWRIPHSKMMAEITRKMEWTVKGNELQWQMEPQPKEGGFKRDHSAQCQRGQSEARAGPFPTYLILGNHWCIYPNVLIRTTENGGRKYEIVMLIQLSSAFFKKKNIINLSTHVNFWQWKRLF